MCEAKPGPRCARHTAEAAENARARLEIEQPYAPSLDPVTNADPDFGPVELPAFDETSQPLTELGGDATRPEETPAAPEPAPVEEPPRPAVTASVWEHAPEDQDPQQWAENLRQNHTHEALVRMHHDLENELVGPERPHREQSIAALEANEIAVDKNTGGPGRPFPPMDSTEPYPLHKDPVADPGRDRANTPDPAVAEVFGARYGSQQERIEAYRAELDKATLSLADREHWMNYLNTVSQFHNYSMNNQLLIQMQRPGATQCAGYKKWQELGRQVNKGEQGIKVLAPSVYRRKREDKNGNPVLDKDGNPVVDERVSFRSVSVFDVSQTSGEDYTVSKTELSTTPPEGFTEDLESAIQAEGFTVSYDDTGSLDRRGYTSPDGKRVVIRRDLPPAARATTLAHELGHIKAGHLDRMEDYKGVHRGAMEVEAESIGYVLCRSNGMKAEETQGQSGVYVKSWSRGVGEDQIKKSATLVNKVVRDLLGGKSFRNADQNGGKPA